MSIINFTNIYKMEIFNLLETIVSYVGWQSILNVKNK